MLATIRNLLAVHTTPTRRDFTKSVYLSDNFEKFYAINMYEYPQGSSENVLGLLVTNRLSHKLEGVMMVSVQPFALENTIGIADNLCRQHAKTIGQELVEVSKTSILALHVLENNKSSEFFRAWNLPKLLKERSN